MTHLLKIEWLKLKSYRTFWFIVILFIFLFLIWNIGANKVTNDLNDNTIKISSETYSFPYVWNTIAYVYRWLVYFLCMFMIISVCNEYTFKTQRQHIIDGMHRLDFLHAKVFLVVTAALAVTIFYTLNCLVFGLINGGSDYFAQIHMVGYVFVFTLNYLSFAALFALLLKRSGLTIILFFGFLMLESGIGALINLKVYNNVGNFLPTQCSDELLPLRSWNNLKSMAGETFSGQDISSVIYLVVTLVYIGIYYLAARRKMLVADL